MSNITKSKTSYTAAETLNVVEGLSKKRLYELMKDGTISYKTEPWGQKTRRIIDGSEIARVFGEKFKPHETQETTLSTTKETNEKLPETKNTTFETKLLEQEVQFLNDKIRSMEEQLDTARDREKDFSRKLDKAQETINTQTLQISDMRDKPEQVRQGFWKALIGKK